MKTECSYCGDVKECKREMYSKTFLNWVCTLIGMNSWMCMECRTIYLYMEKKREIDLKEIVRINRTNILMEINKTKEESK